MKNELIFLIFSILSFLYGVIVLQANSGTRFFLVWFILGGFFLALFLLFFTGEWGKLPSVFRGSLAGLTAAGLILFLAVEGCILSGFSQKGEPDLDFLIVPGAQVRTSGPSKSLKYRLDAAYAYLEDNETTRCIVSGGQGYNEPDTEARVMCDYLIAKGISPDRILLEDQSVNTQENLLYSSRLLDKETDHIAIVTNNFHVFRAIHLARRQGYRDPCAISAPSARFYLLNNMTREFFALIKDFITGHLA